MSHVQSSVSSASVSDSVKIVSSLFNFRSSIVVVEDDVIIVVVIVVGVSVADVDMMESSTSVKEAQERHSMSSSTSSISILSGYRE